MTSLPMFLLNSMIQKRMARNNDVSIHRFAFYTFRLWLPLSLALDEVGNRIFLSILINKALAHWHGSSICGMGESPPNGR